MFILKSAPGSLLSSADTLYLVRNSSEWAHEATAPADSWTQATTDNITTKHFMVTRNTFAKFQRTLFFCFCVHSRSRVRECGRRARRVCPHRSAFPDWRGPRTVPSGPSVSVRWRTQVLFRNRNKMKRHRAFQNLYSEANRILWVIESMTSSTMNLKLIHSATSRY